MISTKRALGFAIAIIFFILAFTYDKIGLSNMAYIFALGFAGGYILNDVWPKRRKKK